MKIVIEFDAADEQPEWLSDAISALVASRVREAARDGEQLNSSHPGFVDQDDITALKRVANYFSPPDKQVP